MNVTLDEIIAKKKQKELEAAKIAEKLAKAKRYKELKKRKNATPSSANTLPSISSCSTSSTTQRVDSSHSKENENPNNVSNTIASPEASLNAAKHSRDNSQLLRKAGALVRDSQDPHTPIWVPGFSYPAQYCIRQTRSLSQKLQVDNVDCINLDDCMFGSQRTKVKVEDDKSDSASVKSGQSTKAVKRKGSRRGKRRRRLNKLSQTSDSSDCGMKLESEQAVDNDATMQSPIGNIDQSILLMDEPVVMKDDATAPVTQQAPLMGGNSDIAQPLTIDDDNVEELLMPECDDVIPSAQPMECDNDTLIQLTQQPTGGNNNTDTPVSQQHIEGNKKTTSEDWAQQSTGNNDSTMYGLTESMLLLIDASCDQQTEETYDQGSHDTTSGCRFWCEQGSNLNNKMTLCNDGSSSYLHCNTVLKHSIEGAMAPLLRVSNIASSTTLDENNIFYITVQLNGYTVVWLHSLSWIVLSYWAVHKEFQSDLTHFHTLSLIGGVAVCMVTTSGTCRVSFIKENTTSMAPQPVVHCICSSLGHSAITCCWTSKSDVLIAISCKDQIVIQMIENYSEKVNKQVQLPFSGEVCSLCGVENNSTTDGQGAWLLAATPIGIAIFDIINECLLQNVSLSCSNFANSLLPKCLRAIQEDCYTFIVLGYEYRKKTEHKVVGWLVAIDNSDDTRTLLTTSQHQRVSYAKLLREYMLPPSSSSSEHFNYLSAVYDNQLVVATPTASHRLFSWDQFTGAVTTAWTISGTTGTLMQCNSTVLAVNGEEDCGTLYIYELDKRKTLSL